MKKLLLALFLLATPAFGQSVIQSGSITPGHAVRWVSNGVVGDAGTAASGLLTSLGVTNNGGPGVCVNSAATTGPYNQICLAATTSGGSTISSYAYGGATSPGITFDINGSVQGFPTVTLPVTNNHPACFDGTTGQIKNCDAGNTIINIEDFGACVACSTTVNNAAIQAAIAATPTGGILSVTKVGYQVSQTFNFDHPMTFLCGYASRGTPHLKWNSLSVDMVKMTNSGINLEGCVFDRITSGTITGDGVVLGDVTTLTSNCSITISTTLLSCPAATFTLADVGKQISVQSAGAAGDYLITTIASFISATSINTTSPSSATVSGKTVYYANPIFDNRVENIVVLNNVNQLRIDVGQKWIVSRVFMIGANGALIQNLTAPDSGEGYISDSTFFPTDSVNGYGIRWTSSGGLKLSTVKITGGKYGFFQNWFLGASGGMSVVNSAVENCTTAAFYSLNTVSAFPRTQIATSTFGCFSGSAAVIDAASTGTMTELAFVGNTFKGAFAGTVIELNKLQYATISDNVIENGGVGTCVSVGSTVDSVTFSGNYFNCATNTSAASPTNIKFSAEMSNFGMANNGIVVGTGGNSRVITAIPALTDGQLVVGQTSAQPQGKTISGDVTFSAAGAATIANDAVTTAKIINDAVTNAKLANVATQTFKGRTTAGTGDPEDLTVAQALALLKPAFVAVDLGTVDFNAVADTAVNIVFPTGVTAWKFSSLTINQASADMTTATAPVFRVFTSTGGGGTALTNSTTALITTASSLTSVGTQTIGANPSDVWIPVATNPVQFRVTTAHGSALTAKVSVTIQLLY